MSFIGNLMREITKAAANVGESLVNGAADVTEAVTGPNRATQAARGVGTGLIQGAKSLGDAIVDRSEDFLGVRQQQQSLDAAVSDQGQSGSGGAAQ